MGFYSISKGSLIMNEKKDIFVISDLHMGDGGPRDNFAVGDKEKQLNLFLDFVKKKNGELIIVGDLFEFWQASLGKVLVKRRNSIDRLGDMGATFVVGNHDADLEALIGSDILAHRFFKKMSIRFDRKIGGKKFMFMHGHEVDPYNRGDVPGLGRIVAIFAGICEDINRSPVLGTGEPVENWLLKRFKILEKMYNWMRRKWERVVAGFKGFIAGGRKRRLTPAQSPKRAKEMLGRYRKDRAEGGYNIAIVGHTHKVGRFEDWYFNSGSWATGENNFLRISDDGKVEEFRWEDGQPIPNRTVLSV